MAKTGYIAFKKNNAIDFNYKIGSAYSSKQGFIVYESIEDSLKGISIDEEKEIFFVKGIGNSYKFDLDFYDYENIQIFNEIEIVRKVTKEEIAKRALEVNYFSLKKLLISHRFSDDFLQELEEINYWSKPLVEYYQKGNLDAFNKEAKLVKNYGKDNNKGCKTE